MFAWMLNPARISPKRKKKASELRYSRPAQEFISEEIRKLVRKGPSKGPRKGKPYGHKQAVAAAISVARRKGYKVPPKKNPTNRGGKRMARPKSYLPKSYIKKYGISKKAWAKYRADKKSGGGRKRRKLAGKYKKGKRVRIRARSTGARSGQRVIVQLSRRSPFVSRRGISKTTKRHPNPRRRRRRRGTLSSTRARAMARRRWSRKRNPSRRRRRRNPGILGSFKLKGIIGTLTNPKTYVKVALVGVGALATVALTKWVWNATVGSFAPQYAGGWIGAIAGVGLSVGLAGVVSSFGPLKKHRASIIATAGVLAGLPLLSQVIGMVSPQAAGMLGLGHYGALPAPSYVGDWVSPETGLGAYNPNLFKTYGGLGDWVSPDTGLGFVPQFDAIPGELMVY